MAGYLDLDLDPGYSSDVSTAAAEIPLSNRPNRQPKSIGTKRKSTEDPEEKYTIIKYAENYIKTKEGEGVELIDGETPYTDEDIIPIIDKTRIYISDYDKSNEIPLSWKVIYSFIVEELIKYAKENPTRFDSNKLYKDTLNHIMEWVTTTQSTLERYKQNYKKSRPEISNEGKFMDFFIGINPNANDLKVSSIISANREDLPPAWQETLRGNLSDLLIVFKNLVNEINSKYETEEDKTTKTIWDPVEKTSVGYDQATKLCRRMFLQLIKDKDGAVLNLFERKTGYFEKNRTRFIRALLKHKLLQLHQGNSLYCIYPMADDITFSPTLLGAAEKYSGNNAILKKAIDVIENINPNEFVYMFIVMSKIHSTTIFYHKKRVYYFGGGFYGNFVTDFSIYLSDHLFTPNYVDDYGKKYKYYLKEVSIISATKLKEFAEFLKKGLHDKQVARICFEFYPSEKKPDIELDKLDAEIETYMMFPPNGDVKYRSQCGTDISGKFDSKYLGCVSMSNALSYSDLSISRTSSSRVFAVSPKDEYTDDDIHTFHYLFAELQKDKISDPDVKRLLERCRKTDGGFYFDSATLADWRIANSMEGKIENFTAIKIPSMVSTLRLPQTSYKGGNRKKKQSKKNKMKRNLTRKKIIS